MRIRLLIISLILLFSSPVFCQSYRQNQLGWNEQNRIEQAIDSFVKQHKYKLGIFRFQPRLTIHGGFDSNTVFGNEQGNEDNDFFISAVPGISGGLKFGSKAYFKLLQDVNFVYYFKNEERSDIFGHTEAEFVTGTPKVLFTTLGRYSRREDRVNQEVDEPTEHKDISGHLDVDYSLTPKTDIRHWFQIHDTLFVETEDTINSGLTLFDRRTLTFGTQVGYALKRTLRLRGDITFTRSETLDTEQVSNNVYLLGGVEMRKDRLSAVFEAGFGKTRNEQSTNTYNFLMDARVDYRMGRTFMVGGSLSRRFEFSFLEENTTLVVTELEGHFSSPIVNRVSLLGSYTIGRNDYGDAVVSGVVVDHDTFQSGELSLALRTVKFVSVRPGIRYLKRTTDLPGLDKSDFFWFVQLGFGYSFNL